MLTSGSDLTSSARRGIALLIAQASSRSGSALTTLPYQPGPNRARSKYTSGASHRPPATAWRNPSARRAKARGTSGGTDEEPARVEGIEWQSRPVARQQVGDDLAGDRREQDALPEMAGGDRDAVPSWQRTEQWQSIRRRRAESSPGRREGGIGQPGRETGNHGQQAADAGRRRAGVVPGLFHGGSHVGPSVRLGQHVTLAGAHYVPEPGARGLERHHLATHRPNRDRRVQRLGPGGRPGAVRDHDLGGISAFAAGRDADHAVAIGQQPVDVDAL